MGNRSVVASLAAFSLVALLCLCGAAALLLVTGGDLATLQGNLELPAGPAGEPTGTPAPAFESGNVHLAPQPTVGALELPSTALGIVRAEEEVLSGVYEYVAPSVVNIRVSGTVGAGQGSGFVWDKEGHIVTNNHVIRNASEIMVIFADTTQFPAEVVGTDPDSDLAVIRIEAEPEILHPVAVGDSGALRVGQRVIAIGNPFGLNQTMTLGVVSGVGRVVPGERNYTLPNLIQTDAAINPGNSGGPLLDIEGRVVGVNTLIYSQTAGTNSGVGFAVPVNKVKAVVPELIASGVYENPFLGIYRPYDLNPTLAEMIGLEVENGLLVVEVVEGSPAASAGLQGATEFVEMPELGGVIGIGGDVIIAIDGQPVRQFADLVNYLDTRRVDDVVTLSVIREGEQVELPVTLGPRP